MPTILHVIAGFHQQGGGPIDSLQNLLPILSDLGCKITLVSSTYASSEDIAEIMRNVDLQIFPTQGPQWVAYSKQMRSFLMNYAKKFDIIHSHGLWQFPSWFASFVAKKFYIKHIITPNGHLDTWCLRHSYFRKKMALYFYQYRALKQAALLHGKSYDEIRCFKQLGLSGPFAMIPNGVAFDMIYTPPSAELALRKWPILKNRFVILSLGRIHFEKGFHIALRAFAHARSKRKDLLYVIAGPISDSSYYSYLKNITENLGITDSVVFLGPVYGKLKISLIDASTLFLAPSLQENFGTAIAESLARGKPVVTTNATPWQLINEYKCGWYVPVEADAIRVALTEAIVAGVTQCSTMGLRCKQLIYHKFNWRKIAYQMLDVYKWILNKGSPPACIIA
uniref:Glycosyltransferase n=1 Tax=candidate division WOR-3 bacterium TaxID=2052148 RepID=A0A7V0Z6K0_UNCW3